jgi:hypothetical protein
MTAASGTTTQARVRQISTSVAAAPAAITEWLLGNDQSPTGGQAAMVTIPPRHGRSSWMKIFTISLLTYAPTIPAGPARASARSRAGAYLARHHVSTNSAAKRNSPASVPTSASVCSHAGVVRAKSTMSRYNGCPIC